MLVCLKPVVNVGKKCFEASPHRVCKLYTAPTALCNETLLGLQAVRMGFPLAVVFRFLVHKQHNII